MLDQQCDRLEFKFVSASGHKTSISSHLACDVCVDCPGGRTGLRTSRPHPHGWAGRLYYHLGHAGSEPLHDPVDASHYGYVHACLLIV